MKISKSVKKLMSVVMMMALVFTSLAIVPKQAKAAADDTTTAVPSVEVLGATLRLNDESKNEKQAMRFAIQIKNADLADDCGIVLTAPNGKEITVSVGKGNKKIYEVNGNTVTYTAAVTGIPTKYAAEDFKFSGFTTPIDSETSTTTESVSRNLTQVANAAGYDISTDNDEITAKEMGGKKAGKGSWYSADFGNISSYSAKTCNISMKVRMQGKVAESTDKAKLQESKKYAYIGDEISFSNQWKDISIKNVTFPDFADKTDVKLYIPTTLWITDDVQIYYKDLSITEVDQNSNKASVLYSKEYSDDSESFKSQTLEFLKDKGYDFTESDISLRVTLKYTNSDDVNNSPGALSGSDWKKNVLSVGGTGSEGTQVSEWSLKEIGDAYTAAGYDATKGVILNIWGSYATVSKIELFKMPRVYEKEYDSENAFSSGTLSCLSNYKFTEENVMLQITLKYSDADLLYNSPGALSSSDWKKNVLSVGGKGKGIQTSKWTLKEIGDAYTAAGYDATKGGVVLNIWGLYATVSKIEIINLPEGY